MPGPQDELLQRLLASQNAQQPIADAAPQQAIAPSVPSLAQVAAPAEQGPSIGDRLGRFMGSMTSRLLGENPRIGYDKAIAGEQARSETQRAAKAFKTSAPIIKDFLKRLPGTSEEAAKGIDGLDDDALKRILPTFGQLLGFSNDQTKSMVDVMAQQETARKNRASEEDADLDRELKYYEASLKGTGRDEKDTLALTNKLYQRTQMGALGALNRVRQQAETAKLNTDAFINNPSGYSDYGLLMTSLKTLQGDTSVVREAELKLGKNAADLFTKAENSLQQAMNGQSLQPQQREDIKKVLTALTGGYDQAFKKAAKPTYLMAKRRGIPIDEVFDDPSLFIEDREPSEPVKPEQHLTPEQRQARIQFLRNKQGK